MSAILLQRPLKPAQGIVSLEIDGISGSAEIWSSTDRISSVVGSRLEVSSLIFAWFSSSSSSSSSPSSSPSSAVCRDANQASSVSNRSDPGDNSGTAWVSTDARRRNSRDPTAQYVWPPVSPSQKDRPEMACGGNTLCASRKGDSAMPPS